MPTSLASDLGLVNSDNPLDAEDESILAELWAEIHAAGGVGAWSAEDRHSTFVSEAWTDEAREKSLETRRARAKLKLEEVSKPRRIANEDEAEKLFQLRDDWLKSLSYDESSAVRYYSGPGYRRINSILRLRKGKVHDIMSSTRKVVSALDTALERAGTLSEPLVVYRGTNHDWSDISVGDVVEDHGFMSTSVLRKVGLDFAPHSLYEITVPKGYNAGFVRAAIRGEYEVLLPRSTKFRVTSIERQGISRVVKGEVVQQQDTADKPIREAWTDEAREKSLETRRARAKLKVDETKGRQQKKADEPYMLSRHELPQIAGKDKPEFVEWLKAEGVEAERKDIPVAGLRGVQRDHNSDKVKEMLSKLKSGQPLGVSPVLVSNDGYVVDGHHRLLAQSEYDPESTIDALKVDLPVRDLLDRMSEFPKSFKVGVGEDVGPRAEGRSIAAEQNLLTIFEVYTKLNKPADWKYGGSEDLVRAEGAWFVPQPLPKDVKYGKQKECFKNAFQLASNSPDKYTYVEGYASPAGVPIPIHHAWVVDKDGKVIDNTWRKPGEAYIGVAFSNKYMLNNAFETGTYGILNGSDKQFRDVISNGFPDGALKEVGSRAAITTTSGVPKLKYDSPNGRLSMPPANPSGNDTRSCYQTLPGVYTTERNELHNSIINSAIAQAQPVDKPTVFMMGGGTASGKSTLRSGLGITNNHVRIDPDEIKGILPEYVSGVASNNKVAAVFVHEESSDISRKVIQEAASGKYNTLLDVAGDGTIDNLTAKVASMRVGGARVVANYATVPTDVAIERSNARAEKTGRYVPPEVIRELHKGVSQVFPIALERELFDEANLWDTSGSAPVLVLSRKEGKTVIHNKDLWEAFLAKGR
jgi:predicted ABC-type ATPase